MTRSGPITLPDYVQNLGSRLVDLFPEARDLTVKGRKVVRQSDACNDVFVVHTGLIAAFKSEIGHRQICALRYPGELIFERPPGVALQAIADSSLRLIRSSSFREAFQGDQQVRKECWRVANRNKAILQRWLFNLGQLDAEERIAHFLCESYLRIGGRVDELDRTGLPFSQTLISEITGQTPINANRALGRLTRRGLTRISGKTASAMIFIADWDALSRLAGFDAAYLG